jgi:hypothetical protein
LCSYIECNIVRKPIGRDKITAVLGHVAAHYENKLQVSYIMSVPEEVVTKFLVCPHCSMKCYYQGFGRNCC